MVFTNISISTENRKTNQSIADEITLITLQRTATHCNALQHSAIHCYIVQHTATHEITLASVADEITEAARVVLGYRTLLQCVAVCCSVLQSKRSSVGVSQCVAMCCIELQCVAVCCSVIQIMTRYRALAQCAAVHCSHGG